MQEKIEKNKILNFNFTEFNKYILFSANYMHWNFVSYLLPYTTLVQQSFRTNLFKDKDGAKEKPRLIKKIFSTIFYSKY